MALYGGLGVNGLKRKKKKSEIVFTYKDSPFCIKFL